MILTENNIDTVVYDDNMEINNLTVNGELKGKVNATNISSKDITSDNLDCDVLTVAQDFDAKSGAINFSLTADHNSVKIGDEANAAKQGRGVIVDVYGELNYNNYELTALMDSIAKAIYAGGGVNLKQSEEVGTDLGVGKNLTLGTNGDHKLTLQGNEIQLGTEDTAKIIVNGNPQSIKNYVTTKGSGNIDLTNVKIENNKTTNPNLQIVGTSGAEQDLIRICNNPKNTDYPVFHIHKTNAGKSHIYHGYYDVTKNTELRTDTTLRGGLKVETCTAPTQAGNKVEIETPTEITNSFTVESQQGKETHLGDPNYIKVRPGGGNKSEITLPAAISNIVAACPEFVSDVSFKGDVTANKTLTVKGGTVLEKGVTTNGITCSRPASKKISDYSAFNDSNLGYIDKIKVDTVDPIKPGYTVEFSLNDFVQNEAAGAVVNATSVGKTKQKLTLNGNVTVPESLEVKSLSKTNWDKAVGTGEMNLGDPEYIKLYDTKSNKTSTLNEYVDDKISNVNKITTAECTDFGTSDKVNEVNIGHADYNKGTGTNTTIKANQLVLPPSDKINIGSAGGPSLVGLIDQRINAKGGGGGGGGCTCDVEGKIKQASEIGTNAKKEISIGEKSYNTKLYGNVIFFNGNTFDQETAKGYNFGTTGNLSDITLGHKGRTTNINGTVINVNGEDLDTHIKKVAPSGSGGGSGCTCDVVGKIAEANNIGTTAAADITIGKDGLKTSLMGDVYIGYEDLDTHINNVAGKGSGCTCDIEEKVKHVSEIATNPSSSVESTLGEAKYGVYVPKLRVESADNVNIGAKNNTKTLNDVINANAKSTFDTEIQKVKSIGTEDNLTIGNGTYQVILPDDLHITIGGADDGDHLNEYVDKRIDAKTSKVTAESLAKFGTSATTDVTMGEKSHVTNIQGSEVQINAKPIKTYIQENVPNVQAMCNFGTNATNNITLGRKWANSETDEEDVDLTTTINGATVKTDSNELVLNGTNSIKLDTAKTITLSGDVSQSVAYTMWLGDTDNVVFGNKKNKLTDLLSNAGKTDVTKEENFGTEKTAVTVGKKDGSTVVTINGDNSTLSGFTARQIFGAANPAASRNFGTSDNTVNGDSLDEIYDDTMVVDEEGVTDEDKPRTFGNVAHSSNLNGLTINLGNETKNSAVNVRAKDFIVTTTGECKLPKGTTIDDKTMDEYMKNAANVSKSNALGTEYTPASTSDGITIGNTAAPVEITSNKLTINGNDFNTYFDSNIQATAKSALGEAIQGTQVLGTTATELQVGNDSASKVLIKGQKAGLPWQTQTMLELPSTSTIEEGDVVTDDTTYRPLYNVILNDIAATQVFGTLCTLDSISIGNSAVSGGQTINFPANCKMKFGTASLADIINTEIQGSTKFGIALPADTKNIIIGQETKKVPVIFNSSKLCLGKLENIIISKTQFVNNDEGVEEEVEEEVSLKDYLDAHKVSKIGTDLEKGQNIVIGTEVTTTDEETGDTTIENAGDVEIHGNTVLIDGNVVNIGDETVGVTNILGDKINLGYDNKIYIKNNETEESLPLSEYISSTEADTTKCLNFGTKLQTNEKIEVGTVNVTGIPQNVVDVKGLTNNIGIDNYSKVFLKGNHIDIGNEDNTFIGYDSGLATVDEEGEESTDKTYQPYSMKNFIKQKVFDNMTSNKAMGTKLEENDNIVIGTVLENGSSLSTTKYAGDITLQGNSIDMGWATRPKIHYNRTTFDENDNPKIDMNVTDTLDDYVKNQINLYIANSSAFGNHAATTTSEKNKMYFGNINMDHLFIRGKTIYVYDYTTGADLPLEMYIKLHSQNNTDLTIKSDDEDNENETKITPDGITTNALTVDTISPVNDDITFSSGINVYGECSFSDQMNCGGLVYANKLNTNEIDSNLDELPIKKKIKLSDPLQNDVMDRENATAKKTITTKVSYKATKDGTTTTYTYDMNYNIVFHRISEYCCIVTGPFYTATTKGEWSSLVNYDSAEFSSFGSSDASFPSEYFNGNLLNTLTIPFKIQVTHNSGRSNTIDATLSIGSGSFVISCSDDLFYNGTTDVITKIKFTPGSGILMMPTNTNNYSFNTTYC